MTSILGDTQGLMNDLTKASTYRAMADLTELGASRPKLEELPARIRQDARVYLPVQRHAHWSDRVCSKRPDCLHNNPQTEINTYSPLYNPVPLVQYDMLQVQGVRISIVFKTYDDGHVTAALRANNGSPIAGRLAEHMGGGGREYAAGFKVEHGRSAHDVTADCLDYAAELLREIDQ